MFYARMNHANTDDVLLDFDVLCPAEGCAPLPPYASAAHTEVAPDINVRGERGGVWWPGTNMFRTCQLHAWKP